MPAKRRNRPNLGEDLCNEMRHMLADCRLPPGERVNEVHLARELGVSRTPVREALARLTAEGLIECVPRRGFFAAPLTVEEVEQLYPIRATLDPMALRLAGRPTARRMARLRRTNDALARARNKPLRAVDLDNQWHRLLISGCENRVLLDLIDQLIWKTRRYEHAYMSEQAHIDVATDEHEAILAALERSDVRGACRCLKRNMTSARPALLAWLGNREASE